jgi:hypothetical protein
MNPPAANLSALLRSMDPAMNAGVYAFASVRLSFDVGSRVISVSAARYTHIRTQDWSHR